MLRKLTADKLHIYKNHILIAFIFGVLVDLLFVVTVYSSIHFSLFIVWLVCVHNFSVSKSLNARLGFLSFVLVPLFLISSQTVVAEKLTIWGLMLFLVYVLLQLSELRTNRSN